MDAFQARKFREECGLRHSAIEQEALYDPRKA